MILAVSLLAMGAGISACKHTSQDAKLAPAKQVKAAAVKKPAKIALKPAA
jgi:hypothetical protein